MNKPVTSRYETRAANLLEHLIPFDEEHSPMPDEPSPGLLVAWVTERLAQAGFELDRFLHGSSDENDASLLQVGVYFLGAAAHAISAIPHVHPEGGRIPPTAFKDLILGKLDELVQENVEGERYTDAREEEWLSLALALLTSACHGTCLLGGLPGLDGPAGISADDGDLVSDLLPEDELEDGDVLEDVDDFLHAGIADSLLRAAAMAATAGQWFIERHERAISSTSAL